MPPNLDRDEKYLLPPSVFGAVGLLRVFVEFERESEGIMDVLGCLALAARANDAFVGVVIAVGRPDFDLWSLGVDWLHSTSRRPSWDTGRALDVSS